MSRRSRVLAAVALVGLVSLSGCLGGFLGGGGISDERLDRSPDGAYAWNQSVDAHITVLQSSTFKAVYRVNGTTLTLYRPDGLGGRNPLDVRSVRYRYPNGTVINGTTLARRGDVSRTRDEVTVTLPVDAEGDRLAFTAGSTPKRFTLPTYVDGTYEIVLPPNRRIDLPVFGQVSPSGYRTEIDGADRVHVVWDEGNAVTANAVTVQFYQPTDLRLLGLLAAVLGVVGAGGLLYYRRQIRELRELRREHGLDVDTDDDSGRDPPPGMG